MIFGLFTPYETLLLAKAICGLVVLLSLFSALMLFIHHYAGFGIDGSDIRFVVAVNLAAYAIPAFLAVTALLYR